jgi:hypothetical protein
VIRSGGLHAPIAFDVVGDDREMDLEFGFGEAAPLHPSEAIAAFPGCEDFPDACTDAAQRTIMRRQFFGGQVAMTFAQQPCGSTRGEDDSFDRQGVVGAVGIDLARLIRNDRGGDRDIGLVGRRCFDRADDAAVLVGGNVAL